MTTAVAPPLSSLCRFVDHVCLAASFSNPGREILFAGCTASFLTYMHAPRVSLTDSSNGRNDRSWKLYVFEASITGSEFMALSFFAVRLLQKEV